MLASCVLRVTPNRCWADGSERDPKDRAIGGQTTKQRRKKVEEHDDRDMVEQVV